MENFAAIIEQASFDHYGVRAHRSAPVVGASLGNSLVWVDGECTDDELDGISTIKVSSASELANAVALLRREYIWSDEVIVLVGGNVGSWGEDAGEFLIRDNVCLAAL